MFSKNKKKYFTVLPIEKVFLHNISDFLGGFQKVLKEFHCM